MIKIVGLTKRFGNFTAVDSLNIEIPAGEFYGILGPNGAGKTTTIKMMTGLFAPTSGTISIGGYDILRSPTEAKRCTGYIPDQPFLYEKLTGREFLYFSAGLYNLGHAATTARISDLISALEIDTWIDRRAEHYSQGMRQRIAIASGLLHDPKVLVIDEPMIGLDPRSAHVVKQVLKEKSRSGTSIFMSTHSVPVVEELCHRVGIVKQGKLIFEDTISSLHALKEQHDGNLESLFLELTK